MEFGHFKGGGVSARTLKEWEQPGLRGGAGIGIARDSGGGQMVFLSAGGRHTPHDETSKSIARIGEKVPPKLR